jgi:tol-pal system protein YbgF
MIKPLAAAARLQLVLAIVVFTQVAAAQSSSSVQESRSVVPSERSNQAQSASNSNSNNDALSLLLEQNRQLSAEVQALRGLLEEQGFELRKLQRDSLSRYTNVDQRLSNLETAGPASTATNTATNRPNAGIPASTTPNNGSVATPPNSQTGSLPATGSAGINTSAPNGTALVSPTATNTTRPTAVTSPSTPSTQPSRVLGSRGTLQPAVLSEQQLYQMAYDSVINSNFELSIAEFDQYLSIYPEGRFVTNAHYWKGQAYLYLSRFEEARSAYEIILNEYSDSAKLPDAMYGLGLAYQGLGNISQARQLLNEIKRRFPNTGVANLADTRLLSLD